MPVAYDKEGKRTVFDFAVDQRHAILYSGYTAEPPLDKEAEAEPKELSPEDRRKLSEVQERARLGQPVAPEERDLLNHGVGQDPRLDEKGAVHEVGSYPEGEHPGALGGAQTSSGSVPGSPPGGLSGSVANAGSPGAPVTNESQSQESSGPEPQEKADTFNPATAERAELFAYLREHGEEVGNRTETSNLRERVYELMNAKK